MELFSLILIDSHRSKYQFFVHILVILWNGLLKRTHTCVCWAESDHIKVCNKSMSVANIPEIFISHNLTLKCKVLIHENRYHKAYTYIYCCIGPVQMCLFPQLVRTAWTLSQVESSLLRHLKSAWTHVMVHSEDKSNFLNRRVIHLRMLSCRK